MAHEFKVAPSEVARWPFVEFLGALQLLAEHRVGKQIRAQASQEATQMRRSLRTMG